MMRVGIAVATLLVAIIGSKTAYPATTVNILAASAIKEARQPQAAIDDQGNIYVTFGAAQSVYCCKSTDGGKSFDKPVLVGEVNKLALGMRRGPRIVADKQAVVITALGHQDGDVLAWRSTDQGESWTKPVVVNDVPQCAREGLHGMAISAKGAIYCVWLDLRNEGTQIYGAESTDGGATWSRNRKVYQSPDETVCECCHPSVVYDPDGNVHVMWRNSIGGNRDMYRTVSRDGGTTFDDALKLGQGSWPLEACPMDGGAIAAKSEREVTTVWRREAQIFETSTTSDAETLIGKGEQPWAALAPHGVYLVWIVGRPGELWVRAPDARKAQPIAKQATDPMVATAGNLAIVVWESGEGTHRTLNARTFGN